jgi:mono/diheme cytochrome c family protein
MPANPPEKSEDSWLILDLPADATQLEVGAEIFRLVCQDCHGNRGQGLTPDWIAQWDPADQNCWQSKCHASNHPPEGFVLPSYVPPLAGPAALARFATATDLQAYMSEKMPWHRPGSLQQEEYWALTAFVLDMNGVDALPATLDGEAAAGVRLRSDPQ